LEVKLVHGSKSTMRLSSLGRSTLGKDLGMSFKPMSYYLTAYLLRISERSSPSVPGQTPACAGGEEFLVAPLTDSAKTLIAVDGAEKLGREE